MTALEVIAPSYVTKQAWQTPQLMVLSIASELDFTKDEFGMDKVAQLGS